MRILVVEDERSFAQALKRGLEEEGFVIDVADDGEEGLWMARSEDYDAVILDVMLPGLNGYRVCSALRKDENWVPILMLTAKDGEYDEAEALDTGADDFLSKPFSYVVLLARLRALLRRGVSERPAVLTGAGLRLDPAEHRCWRGDVELALTPREFALLEFLMRGHGKVLSKVKILEHVWEAAYDMDSNLVEVYVRYLRKKVDLPFGVHSIETVRGVGYRLAASHG